MVLQFSDSRASHLLLHKHQLLFNSFGEAWSQWVQSSYYNLNGFVTTDYQIVMYHTEFNNDLITELSKID
jgi:hypothetical protein